MPGDGPNCFRTHEYRIAIVQQLINKPIARLLIPTRPDESAPRLAPNRLLDVFNDRRDSHIRFIDCLRMLT
jgi:hypothetical protein